MNHPMKTPLLILLAFCASLARADIVTDWNETAHTTIKLDKTPPPKAARALAILHTAIYDAVNGIAQTHERYLVRGKPAGNTGSPATFIACGVVRDPTQPTTLTGLVLDNASQPIGGATCVLTVGIQSFTTTSNAQGTFALNPQLFRHVHRQKI